MISTACAQQHQWASTRALIGGAQPKYGCWAPDALRYKERMGTARGGLQGSPCCRSFLTDNRVSIQSESHAEALESPPSPRRRPSIATTAATATSATITFTTPWRTPPSTQTIDLPPSPLCSFIQFIHVVDLGIPVFIQCKFIHLSGRSTPSDPLELTPSNQLFLPFLMQVPRSFNADIKVTVQYYYVCGWVGMGPEGCYTFTLLI